MNKTIWKFYFIHTYIQVEQTVLCYRLITIYYIHLFITRLTCSLGLHIKSRLYAAAKWHTHFFCNRFAVFKIYYMRLTTEVPTIQVLCSADTIKKHWTKSFIITYSATHFPQSGTQDKLDQNFYHAQSIQLLVILTRNDDSTYLEPSGQAISETFERTHKSDKNIHCWVHWFSRVWLEDTNVMG